MSEIKLTETGGPVDLWQIGNLISVKSNCCNTVLQLSVNNNYWACGRCYTIIRDFQPYGCISLLWFRLNSANSTDLVASEHPSVGVLHGLEEEHLLALHSWVAHWLDMPYSDITVSCS